MTPRDRLGHAKFEVQQPLRVNSDNRTAAWVGLKTLLKSASKGRKEYQELQTKLDTLLGDLSEHIGDATSAKITMSMINSCMGLNEELALVQDKSGRGVLQRHAEALEDSNEVMECYRRMQGHLERIMTSIGQQQLAQQALSKQEKQQENAEAQAQATQAQQNAREQPFTREETESARAIVNNMSREIEQTFQYYRREVPEIRRVQMNQAVVAALPFAVEFERTGSLHYMLFNDEQRTRALMEQAALLREQHQILQSGQQQYIMTPQEVGAVQTSLRMAIHQLETTYSQKLKQHREQVGEAGGPVMGQQLSNAPAEDASTVFRGAEQSGQPSIPPDGLPAYPHMPGPPPEPNSGKWRPDPLRNHCELMLEQVVAEIDLIPGIGELKQYLALVFQAVEHSRVNKGQWKLLRGRCVMVVRIAIAQITRIPGHHLPGIEQVANQLGDSLKVIAAQAQHYNQMEQGTGFLQFEAISEEIKHLFGTLDLCLAALFSYEAEVAQSQWIDEFRFVQERELADLNQIRQTLLSWNKSSKHSTAYRANHVGKKAENLKSKRMSAREMFECLLRHGCQDLTGKVDMKSISEHAVATGAYGDIWKGKLDDGTDVAIKVWRFCRADQAPQKCLKRAMRELYNWSKADHENIQKLLGVIMLQDRLGMVSEWMGNGNLEDYLRRRKSCAEAAKSVQHLHRVGMVHGDLKACNFLVSSDGVVKLTDFDHSIISCHSLVFSQTTTMGGGTMRWMAPELVMDEGDVELRSTTADVYALGMTILEIITGALPYSECQNDAQVFCKLSDKVLPVRTENLQNGRGELLWELLVQCWDHDPTMRPSADQVVDRLLIDTTSPSNDCA